MEPGDIFRHVSFYRNSKTGALEPKYLLILATLPSDDIVARLLTSRPHGRPENPRCFHGYPYSGFYLGVIGGPLTAKSWVDLRYLPDLDNIDAEHLVERGVMTFVASLNGDVLSEALECVAAADDRSQAQERAIRDVIEWLR